MGYSSRYHAASLAAVFIALAIGMLIGIGLADDVVSSTSQELEDSLRSDLDDAESSRDDLESQLGRETLFAERIYPAVVANRLAGSSVAVIGVGSLSDAAVKDVEDAVEPAGASVDARAVIDVPTDPAALAEAAPPRFASGRRGGEGLTRLGAAVGAGLVGDSPLLDQMKGTVFSNFSGSLEAVDLVVFAGAPIEDVDADERADTEALLAGIIDGARRTAAGVVGIERSDQRPGTLVPFSSADIPTVDHADLIAGRVAIVFSLLGAGGDYGVKKGVDSFLPELISPAPDGQQRAPEAP